MKNNQNKLAFIYDLDGTLVDGYLYNQCFDKILHLDLLDEWPDVVEKSIENDAIPNLYFTFLLVSSLKQYALKNNKSLSQIYQEQVTNVKYFNGVTEWFDNINEYAKKRGIEIQHYIVSAGDKELMSKLSIAPHIKKIYGNSFIYEDGFPVWPANVINSVEKTECVYRISKGKLGHYDYTIFDKTDKENKNVPFENIVYLGDGETDIPPMKLVKNKGGKSIAVYGKNPEYAKLLLKDNRVNYIAKADYTQNSELHKLICSIIDKTAERQQSYVPTKWHTLNCVCHFLNIFTFYL